MSGSVTFHVQGRAGRILLPGGLRAGILSTECCRSIHRALQGWLADSSIELVVLERMTGAERLFLSTDIEMLAAAPCAMQHSAYDYLASMCRLSHLIAIYPKPIVTVMDGALKASGFGFSAGGEYQVATERTVVSFPETSFGFVPNAGAVWFLSKLRGEIGTWLALTGTRLTGHDVVSAGLATHYCPSDDISGLVKALCRHGVRALQCRRICDPPSFSGQLADINDLFSGECSNLIKHRLERAGEWARAQATRIDAKSPLSTKILLRHLRTCQYLDSIKEALKIEYRITSRLITTRGFREGVRAMLMDMDYSPRWSPKSLVTTTFDLVSQYFAPMRSKELNLVSNIDNCAFFSHKFRRT